MPVLKNGVRKFPRGVCFDLYGTLIDIAVDTTRSSVWETLCDEFRGKGVDVDPVELHARYDALVEQDRRDHGQPFVLDQSFFLRMLGSDMPGDPQQARKFARRLRELSTLRLQLQSYALDVLRSLRDEDCKIAVVSNTEETLTSHDLDRLALRNYFDAVVLSSAVQSKKPEPLIFQIALDRIGVDAADCVFVGDDYECDFCGARNLGIRAVLLCFGRHPAEISCVPAELNHILDAISSGE